MADLGIAKAIEKPSQVDDQLVRMDSDLKSLAEVINALDNRLARILLHKQTKDATLEPQIEIVPLADDLRNFNDRLEGSINDLQSIKRRLEL